MNKILITIALAIVAGCASQKTGTMTKVGRGDTRTKEVEFLADNIYLLTATTEDKSYGYDQSNPIKVGGGVSSGASNERRFLNALLGPNGEEVHYSRVGSCCAFKTPNGLMNNTGLLDKYWVTWAGSSDTLNIYINMYDKGDLQIPVGLTARKSN